MNAKLIRTEKNDFGATKYIFECSVCGNEYYRWSYNKRTTCYCSDCYNKRQREQAKAWQKRKQQECVDKVLEDIKVEIDRGSKLLCVGSFEKGIAKGLKVALEIIDKHIGGKE